MITDLPTDAYLSAITVTNFLRVLPTRWRQKKTGIDMEQNYVTVTLCVGYISCARRPAALRTRYTNRLDTENNVGARNVRRSEWMSDVLSSAGPHTHTRTHTLARWQVRRRSLLSWSASTLSPLGMPVRTVSGRLFRISTQQSTRLNLNRSASSPFTSLYVPVTDYFEN